MFKSFIRLGLRNLFRKNRLFTVINIVGLAIGMASLLLVGLFINDEYSFDRYHRNADRIYRVVLDFASDGVTTSWAKTNASFGHYLTGAYPEIEQVVRIRKNPGTDLLQYQDVKFYEEQIFFADSTLFRVFDFKLLRGDPSTALVRKNSIVISPELARKYFNKEDPVNKTIRFNNTVDLVVTGVIDVIPSNSHFVADAFITFASLDELLGEKRLTHWGQFDHYTYVLLSNGSMPKQVESKFPALLRTYAPTWVAEKERFLLQPLQSIHLYSNLKDEISQNSQERYSYILGITAFFIFFMACANFINLTTAQWITRTKDVTIQKILGAGKYHIRLYFWIESTVVCFTALLLSYLLAFLAIPYFGMVTGKQLSLLENEWLTLSLILLAAGIGFLSGVVMTINDLMVSVSQGILEVSRPRSKVSIRNALITFQFTISILLMIVSWVVFLQFNFLKSSRLGFESENVVVVPVKDRSQNERHATISSSLSGLLGISEASYSSSMPGANNSLTFTYSFTGTEIKDRTLATFLVDNKFIELYGIKLKDGRLPTFNPIDTLAEVVLNEEAVRNLGLLHPVGQLVTGKVKGRVVGVVENFNFSSLHAPIEPVIMYSYPPSFRYVSVKLNPGEIQTGMKSIEKQWQLTYPEYPLEFFFLNDEVQRLYKSEFQLSSAYNTFAFIAIFIAGTGLIGLSTYLLSRKRKEISIRKVFGGTSTQLVGWIYSGYSKIVIVATVMACGLGYLWIMWWLDGFAFRIEPRLIHFILPVVVMIVAMFVATGMQTIMASRANPSDNLRSE